MPSYSTNLNLAKPTVGGDTNQWGGYLNTNTDTLDGIFNAAGTGTSVGLQVGSGKTLKVGGTLTATGTIQLTGDQNLLKFYESEGGGDNFVGIMAPQQMSGNTDYSLVLPAAQGTAGQFLKLTSLSGSIGLLQFADVTTAADNYFATSGLSNKDLGVGLHLKTGDSGASVLSTADELVIENSGSAGLSILSHSSALGVIAFGDSSDNDIGKIEYDHDDNSLSFTSGGSIDFVAGGSGQDLSVLSNGTVLVGSGSKISSELLNITSAGDCAFFKTTAGGEEALTIWRQAANGTFISFLKTDGNACGSINNSSNGSVTTYATSSDYRLKENEISISDGIDRIKQLNPYRFNFKDNPNNDLDGFFAHEVQEIVPEAVVGEKDGDEMQGIDQAKLVPLITKALQEAITKIESLESEIDQLKGVN